MNVEKKVSKKEIELVLNEEISKSKKIIKLFELGIDVKEISILMNIRYNFSYNVISNYVRMNDINVIKEEKDNKKQEIIKLYREGKSNIEICNELKCNYNYVWKICNELNEKT